MVRKTPLLQLGCDICDGHYIVRPLAVLLIFISLFIPAIPAYAQPPAHLPTDPTVVHGAATFDTVGNQMTVINSPNAILDWQDFSVGANQEVHFQQLNAASQVLNRVTGNDPSQILGSLSSNGGVWLINPHGVLFGQNARIDVAGLVTSTLDISNIDFLAGKYNFLAGGGSPGQVTNQGEIKTPGGNIVLAAGKSLELIDSGAPNVIVRVTAPDNEVANLGSLVAASGGSIDVYGSIVNQQGIIRADSVGTDAAGRVVFTASQALNLAENSETRANGGNIMMAAATSTYLGGLVDVSRQQGTGGTIQLTTGKLEGMAGGGLYANGEQGGNIRVEGTGLVAFSSALSAIGSSHGGIIDVTGDQVYLRNASVDASGGISGGMVHLGGGWQGGGDLPHARQILIGAGSEVKANGGIDGSSGASGSGNPSHGGGEIAVWSTQSSQLYGTLQARDGGRIELSSRETIYQAGIIEAGKGGKVLFDPWDLVIDDNQANQPIIGVDGATFDSDRPGISYIFSSSITNLLGAGTAVVLQANNDLTVNSPVIVSPIIGFNSGGLAQQGDGGNLTLQAGHNITFGADVTTLNGNLTAIAGDSGGVTGGVPTLTINNGVSLDVGSGTAILAAVNGNFVNLNGDSAISTTDGGRWLIYAADPATTNEGFLSYNKHYNQTFGITPDYAAAGNWFFYSVIPTLSVTPSSQTITYGNASPAFNASFTGFIDGDATAVLGEGSANWTVSGATSSTGNVTAGLHNVVYAGGLFSNLGYQFADNTTSSNELSVTAKQLTANDVTVQNKIYDGLIAAPLSGSSLSGVVSVFNDSVVSDQVNLSAAFDNKNVDVHKPVTLGLTGADSGNYILAPFSPSLVADITARSLTASAFTAQDRVYDATTVATVSGGSLVGVLSDDAVSFSGATGTFDNKNVGINKTVSISGISLGGVDGGNYILMNSDIAPTTANIAPATLIYQAAPATGVTGAPVNGLTGTIIGLKGTDTLQNDTAGTLLWTTPASAASPAGFYAINGSGLTARNYIFEPDPGNASALTLLSGIDPANNPKDKQNTLDTSVQSINVAMLGAFPILDWSTTGFVVDLASMRVPNFGVLNLARMSRTEMQQLIDMRREFKEKLFADAIYKLNIDPSLANVRPCPTLADINSGLCRMTDAQRKEHASKVAEEEPHKSRRRTKMASLPQIERKFVVLFGIDQYADKTIPPLENAIFDAEVVGKLFADKLGYEVNVVKNATKADIVRTLNELSTEMQQHDSVIIYYAGHGYRNEKTGGGYWIPADASVSDPTSWISNTDVSKMLSDISAKQMVMISDSCYSGTFAEQKLGLSGAGLKPDEVLAKRSVIVMSSGGDEPVADEGKGGHSIFAWDLMQALRNVDNWQPGTSIFEQVKREVMKSFPQTPQYGTVKSAGHEAGGDYLFEFRQLE
jgi:filamentous hemagglutinin family protein